MAKRKQKDVSDIISELLELAESVNLSSDALEMDIEDECRSEAYLEAEKINSGSLMGQLEYLYEHGWSPERLKGVILEYGESQDGEEEDQDE